VALRRHGIYQPRPGWLAFLSRLVVALGVLAALLYFIGGAPAFWLSATLAERVIRLAVVCAAGAAVYFAALWLLGFRLRDFSRQEVDRDPAVA
jgi:putative peptidoglycan lipid II flippase